MPSLFPDAPIQLPAYQSLLVVGKCHASAPIHLAVSYATENPETRPLVLSPSRSMLKDALRAINDDWITSKSRRGNMLDAVSRVQML
jgi:hypothetical protein